VIIPARFNGPPGSGNGGYSAGTIAAAATADTATAATAGTAAEAAVGMPVEVTLRTPPPLDTPLTLADGQVRGPDGTLVAQVAPVAPFDAAVPPVPYAEAVEAARAYPGFTDHPFPTCYVCGPARPPGDGLRIFPGRIPDSRTAAPWTVPDDVSAATVWAALDCPGGWAVIAPGRPYVLGRIAAVVSALPAPGARCVVVGAPVSVEGRKAFVHSALYGPDGQRLAHARATWVAIGG
jgi:hypothetical protein